MSSFFTAPARKRKRAATEGAVNASNKRRKNTTNGSPRPTKSGGKTSSNRPPPSKKRDDDESISGSEETGDDDDDEDEDEDRARREDDETSESEYEGETAAERRLRLAERYLENIRQEVDDEVGFDAEQIDKDLIAERLKEDVAEIKGKLYRFISDKLAFEEASQTLIRCNTQTITSIAACPPFVYTVSKDMVLTKWKIPPTPAAAPSTPASASLTKDSESNPSESQRKPPRPPRRRLQHIATVRGNRHEKTSSNHTGHTDQILTVAASSDGSYVVTGGVDRRLIIWDAEHLTPLKVFTQHRDAITSLAFRRGLSNQLYSASKDRTIKLWSVNEKAYIETLFGHQDEIVDIGALASERCVSVGARDRTARLWKVVEETQLVFRGGSTKNREGEKDDEREGSIDRIALIDEETFITGSDNGALNLWNVHKKKPIFTVHTAHGLDPPSSAEDLSASASPATHDADILPPQRPHPRWITALTTVPYSDLVLSGSWDGYIRAWRVSSDKRRLDPVAALGGGDLRGFVNDIVVFERAADKRTGNGGMDDEALYGGSTGGARGETQGVCILAAVGPEHRFGRWTKIKKGRNGIVVFQVDPRRTMTNGETNGSTAVEHVDGIDREADGNGGDELDNVPT